MNPSHAKRIGIAEELRRAKAAVAEEVTREFLRRHPDWVTRYGGLAQQRGIEDAAYHVEFLAGAIETGCTDSYANYGAWSANVLKSRGIDPKFLAENLTQVGEACAKALTDSADRVILQEYVQAGCGGALKPVEPRRAQMPGESLARSKGVFLQALLNGQRQAALNVALEALREGHSITEIYVEVFQASLYEVGALWESNTITVAEEHMATAITQYVVAQMYAHLRPTEPVRGKIVIAGVQGEMHQVGANMVADVLEADGWQVRFLGTNMPHAGILQLLSEFKPNLLGISATMIFNVPKVRQLVEEVRQKFNSKAPTIVLGGSAFRTASNLWQELGTAGYAGDLRSARVLVNGLGSKVT